MDWNKVRPYLLGDIEDQILNDIRVENKNGEMCVVNSEEIAEKIISLLEHIDYMCSGNLLNRRKRNGRRKS